MTDDEVYELAIGEGIAWNDFDAILDFMLGFRIAESSSLTK